MEKRKSRQSNNGLSRGESVLCKKHQTTEIKRVVALELFLFHALHQVYCLPIMDCVHPEVQEKPPCRMGSGMASCFDKFQKDFSSSSSSSHPSLLSSSSPTPQTPSSKRLTRHRLHSSPLPTRARLPRRVSPTMALPQLGLCACP